MMQRPQRIKKHHCGVNVRKVLNLIQNLLSAQFFLHNNMVRGSALPKVTLHWLQFPFLWATHEGSGIGGRELERQGRGWRRTSSTLSWHSPATGSMAFGPAAKKKNSSEEMPKWIEAGTAKKHLMLFKCYLVDGSGWYGPTVGPVLYYSPWEQSRWPYVGYSKCSAKHILKQISDSWVLKGNFSYSIQTRVQR